MNFIENCEELAKKHFGVESLRPSQKDVLQGLNAHSHVIATLPTGAGKTFLYTLPSIVYASEGPVVVISPLISLMQDQARRMHDAKIEVSILTSEQSEDERREAWRKIHSQEAKIIFVSPERFVLPSFLRVLSQYPPSMAVIDEAHCVVTWGHHFRPEYGEIRSILTKLRPKRILALTATASHNTRKDIIAQVFPHDVKVKEIVFPPLAKNIVISAERLASQAEQWLTLVSLLKKTTSLKTIVYAHTRKSCEDFADKLRKVGLRSLAYHAGLSKDDKRSVEKYVHLTKEKIIVCATSAFGMGVDVSGVELVVVYGFPSSIEELFQMLGRAGRAGEKSKGILLWTGSDPVRRDFQFQKSFPRQDECLATIQPLSRFFPQHTHDKKFVSFKELRSYVSYSQKETFEQKLESLMSLLRICGASELMPFQQDCISIKLQKDKSLIDITTLMPSFVTQRGKFLKAILAINGEDWSKTKGAESIITQQRLIEHSQLRIEECQGVMQWFGEQGFIAFKNISPDEVRMGCVIKNTFSCFKQALPKYVSLRRRFSESLSQLEKLAKAERCRLSASVEFFSENTNSKKNFQNYSCNQCDLCLSRVRADSKHVQEFL